MIWEACTVLWTSLLFSISQVMQKVIERLAVEDILFIPEAMHGHMHSIAVHLSPHSPTVQGVP